MVRRRSASALLFLAWTSACGDSTDAPLVTPPASTVVETTPVAIRREVFVVDGFAPPPNPARGAATPPEQNRVRVVRYRVDADPPKPARAVVVMMPGFLAGAGSFDGLARALVRRSTEAESFEAWAIDRRSNLLEDTHGLDVAEVEGSATPAYDYYVDGKSVEGRTFAGYLTGSDFPWASEWGLETTVNDLRRVVELVPAAERKGRVVLLGHSLGASIVEAYAAWDFGAPGYEDVAGLVLADGVARSEGDGPESVDRAAYEDGGTTGGFPSPGLEAVRGGSTFVTLPLLGVEALAVAEALAIDAVFDPTAVRADLSARDRLLAFALGRKVAPKVTNRAAFGFPFDEASALLPFAAAGCGAPIGGPLGTYTGAFGGTLVQPTDDAATYDWADGPERGEPTRLADLARAWYSGPGVNFTEWYFPQRLSLDVSVAGTLVIADDDWRAALGLRAKHGRSIDAPVLAAAFRLVGSATAFDKLRALVAPVGAGRTLAGAPRSDPGAFLAKEYPALAHVDGLSGADVPGGAAATFFDDVASFLRRVTPEGGVSVPVRAP